MRLQILVAGLSMAVTSGAFAQEKSRVERSTTTAKIERSNIYSTGGNATAARGLFTVSSGEPSIEIAKIQSCGTVSDSHAKAEITDSTIFSTGKVEIATIKSGNANCTQ